MKLILMSFAVCLHLLLLFELIFFLFNYTAPAVYVLLLEDYPIGTAFAVQCSGRLNKLITAAHCVLINDLRVEGNVFYISLKVERDDNEILIEEPKLKVIIKASCIKNDWAVLMLDDLESEFDIGKCLEICPLLDIPTMRTEPYFKIYHCPASQFNCRHRDSLEAVPTEWMRPLSLSIRVGEISFPRRFFEESSGGAVLMEDKRVVALLSDGDVLSYEEKKEKAKMSEATAVNGADDSSTTSALTNSLRSRANSRASFRSPLSMCRFLSFDENLITALTEQCMNPSIHQNDTHAAISGYNTRSKKTYLTNSS